MTMCQGLVRGPGSARAAAVAAAAQPISPTAAEAAAEAEAGAAAVVAAAVTRLATTAAAAAAAAGGASDEAVELRTQLLEREQKVMEQSFALEQQEITTSHPSPPSTLPLGTYLLTTHNYLTTPH